MASASPGAAQSSAPVNASQDDPWVLATSTQYDPEKIYVRASDSHGHSALMHVKMSPMLYGEIRALVQGGHIPELRTYADVVRDAVIHRMVQYREMLKDRGISSGTLGAAITTEIREAQIDEVATRVEQWDRLIDKLDAQLTRLIQLGDYDTAWFLVDSNGDPEDMTDPFRDRLHEVIRKHTTSLQALANRLPGMAEVPRIGPSGRR